MADKGRSWHLVESDLWHSPISHLAVLAYTKRQAAIREEQLYLFLT